MYFRKVSVHIRGVFFIQQECGQKKRHPYCNVASGVPGF